MTKAIKLETTLAEVRAGNRASLPRLMELVYEPLRELAARHFRDQPRSHTLQPTALVHEVFVRMMGKADVGWRDRAHFFAVCATTMRGILVDQARRRRAAKRGGNHHRVSLSLMLARTEEVDALDLEAVLTRLAELSERQARIVEYRFFAGMTIQEVALALDLSERTVNDEWSLARAWISARLSERG